MQLQKQNAFFEERLAASNAARFGRKTETLEALGQLSLFNEAEAAADEKAAEPVLTGKTSGKKQKGKRQQDLSKLPRTVVPHELSDAELDNITGGASDSESAAYVISGATAAGATAIAA